MAGWCHMQPKCWWGLNWFRLDTGPRCIRSEIFWLLALLKMWNRYFSIYMYKESTECDESKQEKFCGSGFLDVVMWRFGNALKAVCDKRHISRNDSECWSRNFFSPNVKKLAGLLVHKLVCSVKVTVCTHGVKHDIERESEGYCNSGNVGQKCNMHVESSVCRYVICQRDSFVI